MGPSYKPYSTVDTSTLPVQLYKYFLKNRDLALTLQMVFIIFSLSFSILTISLGTSKSLSNFVISYLAFFGKKFSITPGRMLTKNFLSATHSRINDMTNSQTSSEALNAKSLLSTTANLHVFPTCLMITCSKTLEILKSGKGEKLSSSEPFCLLLRF